MLQYRNDMGHLSQRWPFVRESCWSLMVPLKKGMYRQTSNTTQIKYPNWNVSRLAFSSLCPMLSSLVLNRDWRCRWSSAGRRCSNFIWVISNRSFTVMRSFDALYGVSLNEQLKEQLNSWIVDVWIKDATTHAGRHCNIRAQVKRLYHFYLVSIISSMLLCHCHYI